MSKHITLGGDMKLPDGTVIPLSKAIRAGDFIFTSGQLGINEEFLLSDGIKNQTAQCISNIENILSSEGFSLSNVIKNTVWLTSLENFAEFNKAYAKSFSNNPPARSTVCSELAIKGALVEIEAIAFCPL